MKFTEINITEEEVIQSLLDVGFELDTDGRTLGEQMESIVKRIRMIDDLYNIAVELDARETSCNCVIEKLQGLSWEALCNKGIEILEKLKSK